MATSTSARLLVPTTITPAMLGAGTTLAEPATAIGEVAWVSSGTYALADLRTYSGSTYKATQAHTGRTTTPELDTLFWLRMGPTLRTAPFDDYASTKARGTGTLTYVISPGFIDGVNLYGLEGAAYSIIVKSAPGGAVIASKSGDLYMQAAGLWELLFAPLPAVSRVALDDIPMSPTTEVTISVTNGASGPVAIGDIKVGGWRFIIGDPAGFGGTEYGASSELKTYTSRKYNSDGTYSTVQRGSYRDVSCTVVLSSEQALYADATLSEVQNIAVPFEACGLPNYGYLSTLGFVGAKLSAPKGRITSVEINVKGNI